MTTTRGLTLALFAALALAGQAHGANDSYPLVAETAGHKGSAGPRVAAAQWLSTAKRPSVYLDAYFRVRAAPPTGYAGARTGRQWRLLKYRLGYPADQLHPTFGRRLYRILTGQEKRPAEWVARAVARRTSGIVLAKSYPLSAKGTLIGHPFQGTHTLGNYQSDNAVDIACTPGVRVLAPVSGRLFGGYGYLGSSGSRFMGQRINMVGLYRARAVAFYLAHMTRIVVPPFATVRAGQTVGYCGPANGVWHLHMGSSYGFPVVAFVKGDW